MDNEEPIYCSFGCGRLAQWQFVSGEYCCSQYWNQCPASINGNSYLREKNRKKKDIIVKCKICGAEMNLVSFSYHPKRSHGITLQEYYDKYLSKEGEGICKNPGCNNKTSFRSLMDGYQETCCQKCNKELYWNNDL